MGDRATLRLSWDVPVEERADVLVVGGGSAGIAAATAAARNGARTVLVEKYGFLGGTSTAGLVGPFMTSYSADGREPVIGGIFQEVVDRMAATGGAIDPGKTEGGEKWSAYIKLGHAHVTPVHPEALKVAAMETVVEAGARLMLHTAFVDVIRNERPDHLDGIVVLTKAGLSALPAALVVDCSADADVAVRAGVPTRSGRESDGRMMPATMFFRLGGVDDERVEAFAQEHERLHPGERLYECIVQEARARGQFPVPREYLNIYREPEPGIWRANITRLHDIDGTNPEHLTRAEVEGRRQVMKVLAFMRERCPGLEQARLLEVAAQIGIRETRRIEGLYTLTGEDVLRGARFDDAIARCAYPIDIHDPTGTRGKLVGLEAAGYYEIPYRCLVPVRVDNLLVAGRCLSATHEAAASARVIPPVYAMGQAAGTAAALCVRERRRPRDLDGGRLRETLRAQGAIV
ncbi:MAG TPA: FAD-dependent oxidoreductase [Candidatus Methylomirabilis sp.]|nr:FAD-dependent oxidoreductase [Candidatus Methylomirabilis sp.]